MAPPRELRKRALLPQLTRKLKLRPKRNWKKTSLQNHLTWGQLKIWKMLNMILILLHPRGMVNNLTPRTHLLTCHQLQRWSSRIPWVLERKKYATMKWRYSIISSWEKLIWMTMKKTKLYVSKMMPNCCIFLSRERITLMTPILARRRRESKLQPSKSKWKSRIWCFQTVLTTCYRIWRMTCKIDWKRPRHF